MLSHLAQGYVDLSEELAYDPAKANALLDEAGWARGADGIREKDGAHLRSACSSRARSRCRSRPSS